MTINRQMNMIKINETRKSLADQRKIRRRTTDAPPPPPKKKQQNKGRLAWSRQALPYRPPTLFFYKAWT